MHDTNTQTEKLITLANSVQMELPSLTFGRFLPQNFQSIEEVHETSSSKGDVQLQPIKTEEIINPVVRQL